MVGHIAVTGVATGTVGTTPGIWCNNTNQGLTLGLVEGISVDLTTGYFTVQKGYGGRWLFQWNVSITGANGATHIYEVVADPAGAATVVASSTRKLGTGADVGNASLVGMLIAAEDSVFALRISGDATAQVQRGSLVAMVVGNEVG